jgi:putative SOS response-associated peptidase YedK
MCEWRIRTYMGVMCGRVIQSSGPFNLAIVHGMNVHDSRAGNYPRRYDAAPSQELLVIRRNRDTGEVSLDPLRWGLIPYWCKDPKGGRKPINAKAETVARLPMFRDAYGRRRCILPVDGFFEWKAIKGLKAKQPFAIAMQDGSPFGIAGIWENWKEPASGEWHRTFAIITVSPNELLAQIHDRMPAILGRRVTIPQWMAWSGMGVAMAVLFIQDGTYTFANVDFYFAILLFATCLLAVFAATKNIRVSNFLGNLTYLLYLTHGLLLPVLISPWPPTAWLMSKILAASAAAGPNMLERAAIIVVCVSALALCVAAIVHFTIEIPVTHASKVLLGRCGAFVSALKPLRSVARAYSEPAAIDSASIMSGQASPAELITAGKR